VASIVSGTILIPVTSFLAYESPDVIVGEGADVSLTKGIRDLLKDDAAVERESQWRAAPAGLLWGHTETARRHRNALGRRADARKGCLALR
jgi:hypothetical protein